MYIQSHGKLEQLSRSLLGTFSTGQGKSAGYSLQKSCGAAWNMRVSILVSTGKRQTIPPHSRDHSKVRTINQEFCLDLLLLHGTTFLLFLRLDNLDHPTTRCNQSSLRAKWFQWKSQVLPTSAITRTSVKSRGRTWEVLAYFGTDTDPSCQGWCSKSYWKPLAPSRDDHWTRSPGIPGTLQGKGGNKKNTTTTLGTLFPFFHAGADKDGPGCVT